MQEKMTLTDFNSELKVLFYVDEGLNIVRILDINDQFVATPSTDFNGQHINPDEFVLNIWDRHHEIFDLLIYNGIAYAVEAVNKGEYASQFLFTVNGDEHAT